LDRLGTVAIIGVGLIGGSIGLALRARGLAQTVVGIGRDLDRLSEAKERGILDVISISVEAGVANADVVVVCTPPARIAEDCLQAAQFGPQSLLVTDAGSTKARIVARVEADPRGRSSFVAAHPIAGSERKGSAAARSNLFENQTCVLTPTNQTPVDRLDRARSFWKSLGCRILETDPKSHDAALAFTSHLPHAVAAALAGTVPEEMLSMCGGAYRDGTRVAGSDPQLWTEIFLENRGPMITALAAFESHLNQFRNALETDDADSILQWWSQAKAVRAKFDQNSL
jgi:prephenate dehydrogenase